MKIKSISIIAVLVAILSVSVLGVMRNSNATGKISNSGTFEGTIEEKLNNIVDTKDSTAKMSANAYDYIRNVEGRKNYRYIVSNGRRALNYMLNKFSDSSTDGLKEYIMAIACSEILRENPDSRNWPSGREWYDNYIKMHRSR